MARQRQILLIPALGTMALMLSCSANQGTSTTATPLPTTNSSGNFASGANTAVLPASCDSNFFWDDFAHKTNITTGNSRFSSTGTMAHSRASHTATLLPNGKVLVIDGGQLDLDDLLVSIASAEIFDPSQGIFIPTGSPCIARELHTATLLPGGKVLITGGNEFSGYPTLLAATATTELYDPATGLFAKAGNMLVGRSQHTATLLNDGRVLIVGGSPSGALAAEILDPNTGTSTATANMPTVRIAHTATLLPSGQVLIVGGQNNDDGELATAELYDPKTNSFAITGSMSVPRTGHAATLLKNGKVLITGGSSSKGWYPGSTAELFDPLTGTFAPTPSMNTGRIGHTATLLADGTVLIAGGYIDYVGAPSWLGFESTDSAEIYDPVANYFSLTTQMTTTRFSHTATMLPDGTVLLTGGIGSDLALPSAEIFK